MGKQIFSIKGMMRDLDPAKTPNNYAYEIRNLRLTAQEDTTLLALTTEKGNKEYTLVGDPIIGNIIGYCTLNDYLVLFTFDYNRFINGIYRLNFTSNTDEFNVVQLYLNDLGMTETHIMSFEAIGIYENENNQKVYWIDGEHQPRVINIMKDPSEYASMTICPFDFMLEMSLTENVTVEKVSNIFGMFPAGTIQYVCSYFNKESQGTPSFYVSPLFYTTLGGNAVSPDDYASCAFTITIENADANFDYVSIYSICRTSFNGTPICKKVVDLKISDFGGDPITYTDNGISGETVDYSNILYLGGSNIIPYTMSQKSNTLFFGNFHMSNFIISEEDIEDIKDGTTIDFVYRHTPIVIADDINVYYPYRNQLDRSSQFITTFKFGESYYFGIIAQNKYGQWSNVIRLTDTRVQNPRPVRNVTTRQHVYTAVVRLTFTSAVLDLLEDLGCKKLKVVRLDETPQIACQGVLCPTVFNKSRENGGLDYAQSSWYFRPIRYNDEEHYIQHNKAQYYHNRNIRTVLNSYDCIEDQVSEIQGATTDDLLYDTAISTNLSDMDMFVDWNLLTMHSPDIEFGDESAVENIEKVRIVGIVPVHNGVTSMFVDFETPPHSPYAEVDTRDVIETQHFSNLAPVNLAHWSLYDNIYDHNFNTWSTDLAWNMVFPWHKSSTLGTQTTPSAGEEWYAKPSAKCMASLRSSLRSFYMEDSIDMVDHEQYTIDITPFKCCNLVNRTVRIPEDAFCPGQRIYNGTVDKVLQGDMCGYYKTDLDDWHTYAGYTENGTIRMNYKSSTHGVFSIKYANIDGTNTQLVLPNTTHVEDGRSGGAGTRTISNYPVNIKAKGIAISPTDTTNVIYEGVDSSNNNHLNPNGYLMPILNANSSFIKNDVVLLSKSYVTSYEVNGLNEDDVVILLNSTDLDNTGDLALFGIPYRVMSDTEYGELIISDPVMYSSTYSPENWYCLQPIYGCAGTPSVTSWTVQNRDFYKENCISPALTFNRTYYSSTYGGNLDEYFCYIYVFVRQNTALYNYYNEEKALIYKTITREFSGAPAASPYKVAMNLGLEFVTDMEWSSSVNFAELEGIELPDNRPTMDYLYLADLVRNDRNEIVNFTGTNWLIAGVAYDVPDGNLSDSIYGEIGDTYYQRYDCLKTMPFSPESQNQVVDILSFMCETRINIDGRYDELRGNSDNTTMNETNFNKMNMAYTQVDNFFTPQNLNQDIEFVGYFPNRLMWTKTKIYGSMIDDWTHIVSTSFLDIDGNLGKINALKTWNDNLICFQDSGMARIMYNDRTTMSTEQGVPVEIANSGKVDGYQYLSNQVGCSNKDTIQITPEGIYFIDSYKREVYRWSKGLESLSKAKGFNSYFCDTSRALDEIRTFYDSKLKDVYFRIKRHVGTSTTTECLVYNEQLGEFVSFFDYNTDFMFNFKDAFISVKFATHNLWKQFAGSEYLRYYGETNTLSEPAYKQCMIELISAEHPLLDKTFTNLEFRADVLGGSITDVSQSIETSSALANLASINKLPFKTVKVWNEYQDTGFVNFERMLRKGVNLSQKFRIWRADIGRDRPKGAFSLNRIRSPWARVRLIGGEDNVKTVIHDIAVIYV